MQRKALLSLLFTSYVIFLVGSGVLVGQVWAASKPGVDEAVKGASTSDLSTSIPTPSLLPYATFDTSKLPTIYAQEYALYDIESGRTLAESSDQSPVSIASTTKIMTTYIASHYLDPTDVVVISPAVTSQPPESSLLGLHTGEHIAVEQLLYGAMLVSGNDAAYALAEQTGGVLLHDNNATTEAKIARFVEEMNTQAANLHMNHTHYLDPVGINDGGHSDANDLAKLASQLITNPEMKKVIGTATISFNSNSGYHYDLTNSNRLLTDQYPGIIGGKTGYTDAAGHCLVAIASRNGHTLISVILHTQADTNDASAIENRKLLEAGFTFAQWN